MSEERFQLLAALSSIPTSNSPLFTQPKAKPLTASGPVRTSSLSIGKSNRKTEGSVNKVLFANSPTKTVHETSPFITTPSTMQDFDGAPLRPISIGYDSQFTIPSPGLSRLSSPNRENSVPNLTKKHSHTRSFTFRTQSSGAFKIFEKSPKNFGSRKALLQDFKITNNPTAIDAGSKHFDDAELHILNKILTSKTNLKTLEDTRFKTDQPPGKELEMATTATTTQFDGFHSRKKPSWVSPFEIYKSTSPVRINFPKKTPKIILTVVKPQISVRGAGNEISLGVGQKASASARKVSIPKRKSPSYGTQFCYDKNSIVKYIAEFSKLVKLSRLLKHSINKSIALEDLKYQQIQSLLKKIKQGVTSQTALEDFTETNDIQEFLGRKGLYLCVLKEHHEDILRNAVVTERIFSALKIDCKFEFTVVAWDSYLAFIKTVANYETSRLDLSNFVLRFFKGDEAQFTVANFKKIFRIILREYSSQPDAYQTALEAFNTLNKSWIDVGIRHSHSENINEETFRVVYSNNRLSIYSLLNLITFRLF